jgi:hypothetical protein
VRERRWRKGLEESQSKVALFLGWQGSLDVGMLRDCRALSCFGSRVEGDEDGDEGEEGEGEVGVVGVGDDVGEGVGGREICGCGERVLLVAVMVVVVERKRRRRVKKNDNGGGDESVIVERERERMSLGACEVFELVLCCCLCWKVRALGKRSSRISFLGGCVTVGTVLFYPWISIYLL